MQEGQRYCQPFPRGPRACALPTGSIAAARARRNCRGTARAALLSEPAQNRQRRRRRTRGGDVGGSFLERVPRSRAHAHAPRKRRVPGAQSRPQSGDREALSVSERTEGSEEARTVAAEGQRYGSHAGPNAAGRRARELLAPRRGWKRVRHRAPQPPRRRHHAAALFPEPRGTRGPAGRDAGTERAPGEWVGGGASGVSRATSGAQAAPGVPTWSVLPPQSPVPPEASEQSRLVPGTRGSEIRCLLRGRASRQDGSWSPAGRRAAGWSLGPGLGGRMEPLPVGPRSLASASCPRPPSLWRGRLREPGAVVPAPRW